MLDIVIPVYNAAGLVRRCLTSVGATTSAKQHRILVVDDGSDRCTQDVIASFAASRPNVVVLRNPQSSGFCKAANRGMRESSAPVVIILNSDTEVSVGWHSKIVEVLLTTPGVGIAGPLSNAASHQSIPRATPNITERIQRQTAINTLPMGMSVETVNSFLEARALETPVRVPLVHGFCFAIRKRVIESIGYFDEERFPRGYGEENDYCLRAADAGWGLALATDTYVWHEKSASYNTDERAQLTARGSDALKARYGNQRIATAIAAMEATAKLLSFRTEELNHVH